MWKKYNPNPIANRVGDCTVRAIAKATNNTWESVYIQLCLYGYMYCDMPSANTVWGNFLKRQGYERHLIPSTYDCYTVKDFAKDHPEGSYVLAISGHVVCVCDGDYYDSWDSGDEVPVYYWKRGE